MNCALWQGVVLVLINQISKFPCRLWNHHNLNSETHSRLSDFFGGVSMRCLSHLVQMGTRGMVITSPPLSSSTDDTGTTSTRSLIDDINLARLQHIPIFFFSAGENDVFTPESTDISYTTLRDKFDKGEYDRAVFEGFGHLDCWMGERAADVVWVSVREHLIRVCDDG